MKFIFKPLLSVIVLAVLFGYAGCGGNKPVEPTKEEEALTKLNTQWKVGSNGNVTLDGVSKKADYANFTLTLSGSAGSATYGYTTAGRPQLSPWPSGGTWVFTDVNNPAAGIKRDPGVAGKELAVNYTVSATGDQLEISFNYTGAGETRTSKVAGAWIFTLTK
ncbi:MAG TPA: hypothetical protein VFE50_07765 [Cyclobacteriaceae bacterium]|nr:hypothetical protein [Cyclobacteriaceae bacterium]